MFCAYVNNKGIYQTVLTCSLIKIFVDCVLDKKISLVSIFKISRLASFCRCTDQLVSSLIGNPILMKRLMLCITFLLQVSEGTPSPSALPMLPPDFSARKTLSYDESSQDAVNTSFVGEREVVKTEPVLDTDSKDAVRAAIKDVITISDSPIKPVTHKDVKSEPMDTTDSAIVNQEIEKPKEETTVVQYEVTSIVKSEPVLEDVSNSQIDSTSVSEPVKDSTSVSEPVKDENQSNNAINQPIDQEITDTDSASQIIPESTQNDTEVTAEKVATATETVPMATDIVPVATETVSMATDTVVASAVPESVIHSSEAVGSSPLPQESGGSTPVQDERSRSNTPTKDECPGTPVMDEPMVE